DVEPCLDLLLALEQVQDAAERGWRRLEHRRRVVVRAIFGQLVEGLLLEGGVAGGAPAAHLERVAEGRGEGASLRVGAAGEGEQGDGEASHGAIVAQASVTSGSGCDRDLRRQVVESWSPRGAS